jgi:hypothetical protein
MGMPSTFTTDMADQICMKLVSGMSLRKICDLDGMPSTFTVLKWLEKYPEFATQYAHARELQADAYFDEIRDTIDQDPGMVEVTTQFSSHSHVDSGEVQHRKLKVDALKWMAAKLRPKKYGESTTLQAEVNHQHYVAHIPTRRTKDPAEWARHVHAERVQSGELPADQPPPAIAPPPGLPQRSDGSK